ncbi:hypothetical protein C8Q77DRAFT_737220 [Trametes polyzona]|nr:hypothetical protein C8Q77DRAFT_737220 [Trametes polyzona]
MRHSCQTPLACLIFQLEGDLIALRTPKAAIDIVATYRIARGRLEKSQGERQGPSQEHPRSRIPLFCIIQVRADIRPGILSRCSHRTNSRTCYTSLAWHIYSGKFTGLPEPNTDIRIAPYQSRSTSELVNVGSGLGCNAHDTTRSWTLGMHPYRYMRGQLIHVKYRRISKCKVIPCPLQAHQKPAIQCHHCPTRRWENQLNPFRCSRTQGVTLRSPLH